MTLLTPAQREQLLIDAYAQVLARHPDLTAIPTSIALFTAAVFQRIAELERHGGHA